MSRWLLAALLTLVAAPGVRVLAQGEEVTLRHNPFTRPVLGDVAQRGAPAARTEPAPLELRATLVGGGAPLANIDGKLLGVGDEIAGYRLARIGEGYVELVKGEETRSVPLRGAARTRNEERR